MNDTDIALTYGENLTRVAGEALLYGLEHNAAPIVDSGGYPSELRIPRATFVTLEQDGELRGCIGSVAARRALVEDVASNAYGAGFRDPRFAPITHSVFRRLSAGISILGPFETLTCSDESDLFRQARAGIDGFVLSAEGRRGLFLPQVWDTLPTAQAFFETLRDKAGLPRHYWSPQLRIERFQVVSIPKRPLAEVVNA